VAPYIVLILSYYRFTCQVLRAYPGPSQLRQMVVFMEARERLAPLTGLRGVAGYAVLLGHALDTAFTDGGRVLLQPFSSRVAYFGMSLFFVLSGFVIAYNYTPLFQKERARVAILKFFAARFARLYPLYAISLLVLGLGAIPSPYFNGWTLLSYLTLTQSWFNVQMATFPPDWSLSTEWFFYFAFVPLVLLMPQSSHPLQAISIASAIAVACFLLIFGPLAETTKAVANTFFWHGQPSADPFSWARFLAPYVRLPEFLLGLFAARAFSLTKRAAPVAGTLGVAWCIAVIAISPLTAGMLNLLLSNFIFAPAIALIALSACQNETTLLSRWLSSKPLIFAGEISFSVYIWSWAVMSLVQAHLNTAGPLTFGGVLNSALAVALIGLLTTAFAYGSFLLIEMPPRQWLRRMLGG
jgi:peptidoglycan/LPS O-acetylase OafA/YrhL